MRQLRQKLEPDHCRVVTLMAQPGAPFAPGLALRRTARQVRRRLEVLRAGFKAAWAAKNYKSIIAIAQKIPEEALQEDGERALQAQASSQEPPSDPRVVQAQAQAAWQQARERRAGKAGQEPAAVRLNRFTVF